MPRAMSALVWSRYDSLHDGTFDDAVLADPQNYRFLIERTLPVPDCGSRVRGTTG